MIFRVAESFEPAKRLGIFDKDDTRACEEALFLRLVHTYDTRACEEA
jgi:hypothetical protein